MWHDNNEFTILKTPTGGVVSLRHDLARDEYIRNRKAQRDAAQQDRVNRVATAVFNFVAGVMKKVFDASKSKHNNPSTESAG